MSLLDDVSIVVTPNGYKAGELYAVVPVPTEGAELLTNGDFASDLTGWTGYGTRSATGGVATIGASANSGIFQGVLTQGVRYNVTVNVTSYDGVGTAQFVDNNGNNLYTITSTGIQTFTFISAATTSNLIIRGLSNALFSVSSVSVKEYTSADMDVTRATAATRVDEAGLVNYAEIIGGEEVDISSGSPVVPSDWSSATANSVNFLGSTSVVSYYEDVATGMTSGKTYRLQLTISGYSGTGNTGFSSQGGTGSLGGVPNVYADGVIDVLFVSDGANLRIFSRNTITNVVFSNASVKEVTRDNVPRIDYTGGGCPHILAEPQRTNLITYSEDFSQWIIQSGITITTNTTDTLSPSGLNDASKVVSTDNTKGFYLIPASTTSDVTRTIYLKGSVGGESVTLKDGGGFGGTVTHTLTTEWVRYEFKTTNDGNTYKGLYVDDISVGTIYVWGAQLEEGSYATSYIPTSGSTVTRNQDIFTRDGIGSLINSTEGTLVIEPRYFINDGSGTGRKIAISDGTGTNRIYITPYQGLASRIRYIFTNGGATQADLQVTGIDITISRKLAFVWKANRFELWQNGSKISEDTSGTTPSAGTFNQINFSSETGNGSEPFEGELKQLQVYKTALTDEQLLQLTGESGTDFYESYAEMASALTYTIQ